MSSNVDTDLDLDTLRLRVLHEVVERQFALVHTMELLQRQVDRLSLQSPINLALGEQVHTLLTTLGPKDGRVGGRERGRA